MSNSVTTGLNDLVKSWRENNHNNVAVVRCWICHVHSVKINRFVKLNSVYLTREMFDSKHFWMYIQLNSAPLAPTHNINPRDSITSAAAHPKPALINLLWPLPGMRDKTNAIPSRSKMSTLQRRNSWQRKYLMKWSGELIILYHLLLKHWN